MSPVHVLLMSPVHVLQMSPVHVLQMSPVQVLQVQSSPGFTTCPSWNNVGTLSSNERQEIANVGTSWNIVCPIASQHCSNI
jgi:hypothetical protein